MHPLSSTVFISGQITEDDISAAKDAGVTDVMMNRPDGEEPGQPDTDTLAKAYQDAGINFHHLPMSPGQLSVELIEATADLLNKAEGKIWAFCKTGGRSATLWALGSVRTGQETPESAIEKAANIGFDLSGMRPLLEDIARSG